MFTLFYPHEFNESIFHINYEKLYENGFRGLIFDIDNTLVPFDIKGPTEEITTLFTELLLKGFKICLVSNNGKDRVDLFNESLKLPAIARAKKPLLTGVNKAIEFLGTGISNTAFIGDQVFTDVWCGKRKGLYTILVKPVALRDEFSVKLKRGAEKFILKQYFKSIHKG